VHGEFGVGLQSFLGNQNLTICCNYGGAPGNAHVTVNQHPAAAIQGGLDKATCNGEVYEDVIVFRVLHWYSQVVGSLWRIIWADRDEVGYATTEVD
jgi:hypothetical protein